MGPEPLIVIVCSTGIAVTLWRCRRARHAPSSDLPPINMDRYR